MLTGYRFVPVPPYPMTNSTLSVGPSETAPLSSGTGVSTTSTAPSTPEFTAGVGKMAVNVLAMGLMGVGAALLFW